MDLSNENVIHIKNNGIEYIQFRKLLEFQDIITHAFTVGREADYRQPCHKQEVRTFDEHINNYKKVCNSIGIQYNDIVKTNQVHGDNVMVINKKENNNGPDFFKEFSIEADGFITNKKNLALCTTNADCILLMMFDTKKHIVANVHSGWRGTTKKIALKTIDKMQEVYNCNPRDIICCISPSIRKCHFEVDEDVKDIFTSNFQNIENEIEKKGNKWYIDTVEINKKMLIEKGLLNENIVDSKICTVCNSDIIHSYRGNHHKNGLEMSLIELK